jgi:hypothetical protein
MGEETSSGQPTPEGSFAATTTVAESEGRRRDKPRKAYTKPNLNEFGPILRPVFQLAKRAYTAYLLSIGPALPTKDQKKMFTQDAYLWSIEDLKSKGSLTDVAQASYHLTNRGCTLVGARTFTFSDVIHFQLQINESWDKIKEKLKPTMEDVVAKYYQLPDASGQPNIPGAEITSRVDSLLGPELKFIWDKIDPKVSIV